MSNKIVNDKYYTPKEVVDLCLSELREVLKQDGVKPSLIIEPSAGNGAFSSRIKNCVAYDIEPEADGIVKQDFLELEQDYMKGIIVVGNPPFGARMNLARQFFKKSIKFADYVAFILPISQLNSTHQLYEFDLVKSIDLGRDILYTDRKLHCCFNIYRRPSNGKLNNRKINTLDCVKLIRQDSKNYEKEWCDVRLCYWGNGSAGKLLYDDNKVYSAEYKIQIHECFKKDVIRVLEEVKWRDRITAISMLRIGKVDVIELLKEKIEGIY